MMSSEIAQKRGRPKKVEGFEILVDRKAETTRWTTPKTVPPVKVTAKPTTKPATLKSNVPPAKGKAKTASPEPELVPKQVKAAAAAAAVAFTSELSGKPKPVSEVVSRSKILQELAALDNTKQAKRFAEPDKKAKVFKKDTVSTTTSTQTIEAPPPSIATETVPIQIPSYQAATMPTNPLYLLFPHSFNASILQQTAFMSTKADPSDENPKVPRKPYISPKALNAFAVNELSARRGPGAGAEHTRAEQAKVEAPKILYGENGKLHPKYRPAGRRILATIVAMPIVIVTSYILYQRLVLGVEVKQFKPIPFTKEEAPRESGTTS